MPLWIFANTPGLEESVDYTLRWGTTLPPWAIGLLVFVFGAWVYGCYRYEVASSSNSAKFFLATVRWAILAALLAILCEPLLEKRYSKTTKSCVIVMVDTSLSMNIQDQYQAAEERKAILEMLQREDAQPDVKIRRMEIIAHLLSHSKRLQELQNECDMRFFGFDTDITPLADTKNLEAKGQLTNIYDSITKALDSLPGKRIAAIFVLTDGQHNTGKQSWQQVVDSLKQRDFPVPIYPVGIGSSTKKRDVILVGVEAPEIALIDDKVRFDLEIRNTGFVGETIPVYLKWGETRLTEEMVTLPKEDEVQKVSLYHTFRIADDYQLTIVIPEQSGEFSTENNFRQHNIKIIQQKLKVLYLEGPPRWEYRYLKNALIRDETVLAHTWLFSADADFPQEKSKNATALAALPDKETLFTYHCVILGDVSPEQLGEPYTKYLVEFVKDEGGGIVFIPGYYNPAEYWETPLADLLPVIVEPDNEDTPSYDQVQRPHLTPEGKLHPIMRLLPNQDDNIQLWENERDGLPGFYWYFPVQKTKPGATTLAIHSTKRKPLIVTQFYGKGKSLFTAIDESWRWRYLVGDRYFYRFWGQAIRHVSMGLLNSGSRKYYLRVDNTQYAVGEMVNIVLRIRDPQTKESDRPGEWELFFKSPGGEEETKKLKKHPNDPDTYEGTMVAARLGTYKLWFTSDDGKETSVMFQVVAPMAETEHTHLNEPELIRLAKQTDGQYLKPYALEAMLNKLAPERQKITSYVRQEFLWDRSWAFWLMVALFALEWIVRKLCRML